MIFHSTQYSGQAAYLWEILADMNTYNMELPLDMNMDNVELPQHTAVSQVTYYIPSKLKVIIVAVWRRAPGLSNKQFMKWEIEGHILGKV